MKKELANEMKAVLKKYEWNYTEEVIDKFVDNWFSAKKPLIELLSKHPNYNKEKHYISFDVDYERKIDIDEICNFRNSIIQHYQFNKIEVAVKISENFSTYYNESNINFHNILYHFFYILFDGIFNSSNVTSKVTEENKALFNHYLPELKVKKGQKLSRLVNKICIILGFDQYENYERIFANFADAINPLTIKRHTVISVNPMDYILMSNGNSWSSCHTPDVKQIEQKLYRGESCNACWSYMFDSTTIVMYTVDSKYNGNDLELQKKINRQLFYYQNNKLLQARLYPQNNDGLMGKSLRDSFRNIMQKVIADCKEVPNLWTLKQNVWEEDLIGIVKTYRNSTHYPDYLYEKNCSTLSKLKLDDFETMEKPIKIGSDSYCIKCGRLNNNPSNMYCEFCCEDNEEYDDDYNY